MEGFDVRRFDPWFILPQERMREQNTGLWKIC